MWAHNCVRMDRWKVCRGGGRRWFPSEFMREVNGAGCFRVAWGHMEWACVPLTFFTSLAPWWRAAAWSGDPGLRRASCFRTSRLFVYPRLSARARILAAAAWLFWCRRCYQIWLMSEEFHVNRWGWKVMFIFPWKSPLVPFFSWSLFIFLFMFSPQWVI